MKLADALAEIMIDWLVSRVVDRSYEEYGLPGRRDLEILYLICCTPNFALFKDLRSRLDTQCGHALDHIIDSAINNEQGDISERKELAKNMFCNIKISSKTPRINQCMTEIRGLYLVASAEGIYHG